MLSSKNHMKTSWQKAKEILSNGGIVVLPTDTIYGIAGSAFSKIAIERMYKIKERDKKKPFIILIPDLKDLKKFKIEHSNILQNVGMLKGVSILFPCSDKNFSYLHRGTKKIAFRQITQKNKNLYDLIKKVGPIATTSVNPQNLKPAETISEAKKYFSNKIDLYVSGGKKKSNPSTLIEFKNNRIIVLRQGLTLIK